jgi:hypothetical protein
MLVAGDDVLARAMMLAMMVVVVWVLFWDCEIFA